MKGHLLSRLCYRCIAIIAFFSASPFLIYGQEYEDHFVKKGDFIISSGYGVPSALRVYLNREKPDQDLGVRGYGPVFLKIDYALFEKFTIGLNGFYNYSDVHWMDEARDLNGIFRPFRHGVQVWEAAMSLRLNYYFLQKNIWNFYAGAGMGMGYANAETYALSPREKIYINHRFPTPYNFEGTVGTKCIVTDEIGLYTELGIGQSWLLYNYYFIPAAIAQFGVTIKL